MVRRTPREAPALTSPSPVTEGNPSPDLVEGKPLTAKAWRRNPGGSPVPIPDLCHRRLRRYPGRYCTWSPIGGEGNGRPCRMHGGKAPQVQAKVNREQAVTRAVAQLGDVVPIDAASALEDAIARLYAGVLAYAVEAHNGDEQAEAYRRWIVDLGKLAKDTHAAGLDERRLQLEQAKASVIAECLEESLTDLEGALQVEVRRRFGSALRRRLGAP